MGLPAFFEGLPGAPRHNLALADRRWERLRRGEWQIPQVVSRSGESLAEPELDVVIAGGTLGILLAAALQRRGLKVLVMERGILRGREQEWNISRRELETFLTLDLLTPEELETAIASEYNPARLSFHQSYELWVRDILNVGVDPVYLLATLKEKFLTAGGRLWEQTQFERLTIHPQGVRVEAQREGGAAACAARLFIDAMGHFSPIVQQIRGGQKPDAVCLVVGGCAQGYPRNETGDLIATFTPILHQCQYFWEAFPARDGRTTYLFTYVDAAPERFSLEFLLEEYFAYLPQYQDCELEALSFKRALWGFFPAYRNSPLQTPYDRVLAIGDSAGAQSPISFGGFGAMVRHLPRLTTGVAELLQLDDLSRDNLALLQPYQPNIAVTWLFQKTMSVGLNQKVDPQQINRLMGGIFQVMAALGEGVWEPFLTDVIQFGGLSQTLTRADPRLVLPLLPQIGLDPLADWLKHYFNLGLYSALAPLGERLQPLTQSWSPEQKYRFNQRLQAWRYGAGVEGRSDSS
ncbi:MAG: FAD-binding oxidoreductase [Cyanobacteria bacterium RI_101]|nr:FAD-binding oxidoreductase [Cyanobacteria bacterium RI_101]